MSVRAWDKKLWGVVFRCNPRDVHPMLIGAAWDDVRPSQYDGEPARALLFCTRRQARAWCKDKAQKYADRSDTCGNWRFTPVRVREVVKP